MFIGVPKEIKSGESRVGLVPATVAELVARGHGVGQQRGLAGGDQVAGQAVQDDLRDAAGAAPRAAPGQSQHPRGRRGTAARRLTVPRLRQFPTP